MKPWREVLDSAGWVVRHNCGVSRSHRDDSLWWVYVSQLLDGSWSATVDSGDLEFAAAIADTEDAAFTALMSKPIGPGRVTVGVLLGVMV